MGALCSMKNTTRMKGSIEKETSSIHPSENQKMVPASESSAIVKRRPRYSCCLSASSSNVTVSQAERQNTLILKFNTAVRKLLCHL